MTVGIPVVLEEESEVGDVHGHTPPEHAPFEVARLQLKQHNHQINSSFKIIRRESFKFCKMLNRNRLNWECEKFRNGNSRKVPKLNFSELNSYEIQISSCKSDSTKDRY